MVKFSPAAIAELHRWSRAQGNGASPDAPWTVTLQKVLGGCRQWSYDLQLSQDDANAEGVIALDGKIQLQVAGPDQSWCDNLTVDYSEDLIGGGFRFMNPNATETCSCSASFEL